MLAAGGAALAACGHPRPARRPAGPVRAGLYRQYARADYLQGVKRTQNYSRRGCLPAVCSPAAFPDATILIRSGISLRRSSPSPYMLLRVGRWPWWALPEAGDSVGARRARPIAGTRPRSLDGCRSRARAGSARGPQENAERVMLVDLARGVSAASPAPAGDARRAHR